MSRTPISFPQRPEQNPQKEVLGFGWNAENNSEPLNFLYTPAWNSISSEGKNFLAQLPSELGLVVRDIFLESISQEAVKTDDFIPI